MADLPIIKQESFNSADLVVDVPQLPSQLLAGLQFLGIEFFVLLVLLVDFFVFFLSDLTCLVGPCGNHDLTLQLLLMLD